MRELEAALVGAQSEARSRSGAEASLRTELERERAARRALEQELAATRGSYAAPPTAQGVDVGGEWHVNRHGSVSNF